MPIKLTPANMRYDEAEDFYESIIKKVKNNIYLMIFFQFFKYYSILFGFILSIL